jgi:acetyl-CoA acetyltransferase family protein
MPDAYIIDALRAPFGRHGGGLAGVRPDDLAAFVVGEITRRSPQLDPAEIDEVLFGNANGAGEENRNVARMAVLLADLPTRIPASTTNRLCGSSLDTAVQAARAIETGDAELVLTGGVESMSRAPWVVPKPERPYPRGPETMHSTTLGWRLVNPAMPEEHTVSLGEGAEILSVRYRIDRERQDEFALASHRRAHAAWERGAYAEEVVDVPGTELSRDETIRADTSMEKLAKLPPVFRREGSVTAGNASPMNDGAGAVLVGTLEAADRMGRQPLARIAARAASALEPRLYGLGPVEASEQALRRAGIGWDDLELVEINEAFAAQTLACLAEWPDLDPERVNVNGGAIALGHPLGASGARLLTTLAHELRRRGGGWGLATLCIGVGQGLAVALEA